jgi:diguanylate cyclase (GGDEF)-like protein/PAS domain S-box-containing protein
LIGATAVELGEMLPVPIYRTQPGVVVQALAAQSLRQGALRAIPQWLGNVALAVLALAAMLFFNSHNWRQNAVSAAAAVLALLVATLYAYSAHRLIIEVAPALALLCAAFLIATIRSLDRETLRAFAYALGIRQRDALLGSIVESSTDCIVCIDASGRIETANAAGARLFGCELSSLIGAPLARFVPVLSGPLNELCNRVSEQTGIKADGSEFPVEISVSQVGTPGESLFTVIIRDISERRAQEQRLQYQATHDPLTALPNRAALATHLEEILGATPRRRIALLMLDLCRFKEVNDTLGHHVGDQVLREVARRLAAAPGVGFVARIGGDEFTMVCRQTERSAITKLAQALHDAMRAPIEAADIAIDIGLSIGIAIADSDAPDAATLLRHADVAMYVAKRRGLPWEFYDPAADQNSVRRLAMVGDLRHAIASGTLSLHYQPQVDLRSDRSFSAEALLRWRHPEYGNVSPAEFISVAESTDLIRPLTFWTLSQALTQAARWRREGIEPRVAVNLSARLLQDTDFPTQLRALLQAHEAIPASVELEITESAVMHDPARALRVAREIHALGVLLSVDDFGTGYSSLAYLRDLPVHALKLDRSFVLRLQESARDRSIVNSTVRMAHELGLQVVAEGVETEWAAGYLADIGYDYAQGYCYSPALQADQCRLWMERFNARCDDGLPDLRRA